MILHNVMEDIVLHYLEEVLESKKGICKCGYCVTDMLAYALNRVKPMYVVSSRGIIHTENTKRKHIQEEIDIYSTVIEAINVVSGLRRHEVDHSSKNVKIEPCVITTKEGGSDDCYFNFPQVVGRILDGNTIKTLSDLTVSLYYENGDELVSMCNNRWDNPIKIIKQMEGTFTFWPAPIKAEKSNIQKDFYMNLKIEKDGYEICRKYFFVRIISENDVKKLIKKENIYYLDDIFISSAN